MCRVYALKGLGGSRFLREAEVAKRSRSSILRRGTGPHEGLPLRLTTSAEKAALWPFVDFSWASAVIDRWSTDRTTEKQ